MSSSYGETFAPVYDRWYPPADRAAMVVSSLAPPRRGARLLELGVGTGALAVPLAEAGWAVVGLDDSPAMLARLDRRLADHPEAPVTARPGDAADPGSWPAGPFDVVLAAWNLVANVLADEGIDGLFAGSAAALAPDGHLVVEADVPRLPRRRERRVGPGPTAAGTVRIHTDTDPATGLVEGRHVALDDGRVDVLPWRLRLRGPEELDRRAAHFDLVVDRRWSDWAGTRYRPGADARHVSWYRRVSPRPAARPAPSPR